MVFSILNFLIKKLISEYSLEFGFVSWGSSPSLLCPSVMAARSARAASAPEEVRAEVCTLPPPQTDPVLLLDPCWPCGLVLTVPVRLGSVFASGSLPVLSFQACQSGLWWVFPSSAA